MPQNGSVPGFKRSGTII